MEPRALALAALAGVCLGIPALAQQQSLIPALSLPPAGTTLDREYWSQELARRSRAKARARTVAVLGLPEVQEQEPPNERHWNDTQSTAEYLPMLARSVHATLLVRGVLSDSLTRHLGSFDESSGEDDGSIPLARDTPLQPGDRIRLDAEIGDSVHGSRGTNTADYDFYRIGRIEGGRLVTAQIRTPADSDPRLETKVGLYDSSGVLLAYHGSKNADDPDSFLEVRPKMTGDYWILVRGTHSDWPSDPFDSASGPKAGSEGPYTLTLGLDAQDVDFFSFDLEEGDVISAGTSGEARYMMLFDADGLLRMGSFVNWSYLYPPQTPLYTGGRANVAAVATRSGRYAMAVTRGGGPYSMQLSVLRPPLATALAPQILFVDFDGATLDGFRNVGYAELSSLSTLLSRHQLEHEEDRIIDVVMATLQENLVTDLQSARNTRFDLVLRNSRDDADPWGDPYVSRVIVGGTQQEIGRSTLGVAESIDVGNFDLEETAVVLLDRLTNPNDPGSPSSVPYAPPLTVADVIGTAIGAIAAHEAGHLFASFHTGHPGYEVDLMDAGEDPSVLLGYGPDGILGTSDDVDVDFNDVPFYEWEPFDGVQDSRNAIAYSLYQPVPTAIQEEPGILDAVRTTAVWPNPAIDRIHITMRAARPVDVRLSLYDVLGRRVRTQGHALRPGETRVVLPVDGLPAGVYLLRSDGVAGSAARAVIIAR